ncbi:MAG: OmpH family outer membrane protein [Gammaproteobacteria bacterium]|nr:OmpH family outer membrane protein [Gammaproteobacteria bacterium]MXY53070.1 OmpH family outer membrane protein [Gammaproteobacteria bacterium]
MAKRIAALAAVMLGLVAPSAFAELKVAVLDTAGAVAQSEEATEAIEVIRKDLEPEQERLQGLQAEIQALQERAQNEADVMSEDERRAIAREIQDKQFDLEADAQRLQKSLQDKQEDLQRTMLPKVRAVLDDLIKIEGYDFVMEKGGFLYVNPKHDITAKVTEKLNEKR